MTADPTNPSDEGLTDERIAQFWDYDLSEQWVRETLARRIRNAGYVVVPAGRVSVPSTPPTRDELIAAMLNIPSPSVRSMVIFMDEPEDREDAGALADAVLALITKGDEKDA